MANSSPFIDAKVLHTPIRMRGLLERGSSHLHSWYIKQLYLETIWLKGTELHLNYKKKKFQCMKSLGLNVFVFSVNHSVCSMMLS